jgi:hypothetical protein
MCEPQLRQRFVEFVPFLGPRPDGCWRTGVTGSSGTPLFVNWAAKNKFVCAPSSNRDETATPEEAKPNAGCLRLTAGNPGDCWGHGSFFRRRFFSHVSVLVDVRWNILVRARQQAEGLSARCRRCPPAEASPSGSLRQGDERASGAGHAAAAGFWVVHGYMPYAMLLSLEKVRDGIGGIGGIGGGGGVGAASPARKRKGIQSTGAAPIFPSSHHAPGGGACRKPSFTSAALIEWLLGQLLCPRSRSPGEKRPCRSKISRSAASWLSPHLSILHHSWSLAD